MNRLKELRGIRYNQSDVAKAIGVGRTTYSKYETGDISLTEDMLRRLSAFFGVTTDYILGLDLPVDKGNTEISAVDYALNGELHDLTEDEKRDILDYIRFKKLQKR